MKTKNMNKTNNNIIKPFSFFEHYTAKEVLNKILKEKKINCKLIPKETPELPHCNLDSKTIYLPFVKPLSISDLKVLLDHEIKHFEVTKRAPRIRPKDLYIFEDYHKLIAVLNILEDIIVNKDLPREKLEKIYKKLGSTENQITLWEHFSEEEKRKIVKNIKDLVFKSSYNEEEIISIIDQVIKRRKAYSSLDAFFEIEKETLKKFYDIFKDSREYWRSHGDGPCLPMYDANSPNEMLVYKFKKIFERLRVPLIEEKREEKYIGKRINRRFLFDKTRKPFIKITEKTIMKKPKVVILMDCSGSMYGEYEVIAKSFINAALEHLEGEVIMHNQYYSIETNDTDIINGIACTGDEHFEKLDMRKREADVLIVITDLIISSIEREGLIKFIENVNAKYKYLLCVSNEYAYRSLREVIKIVYCRNESDFFNFCKKLVSQFT